jgi:hypothetical protein
VRTWQNCVHGKTVSIDKLNLMNISVQIRHYKPGEERALFEVYYSAIHLVASRDYTSEQIRVLRLRVMSLLVR